MFHDCKNAVHGFGNDEVLLDNQASRSVFKNKSLMSSIVEVKTYQIGGVNPNGKPLIVNKAGNVADLKKLNGKIGYAPDAVANILSMSQLVDCGYKVILEDNTFRLSGDVGVFEFCRKKLQCGLGGHYLSKFVPSIEQEDQLDTSFSTTSVTVEDTQRRFSVRDQAQAKKAVLLKQRLGHASDQAVIDIMSKLHNCDVSTTDVKNATLIYGPSIPALKGKTKKQSVTRTPPILAPRVTQVQQSVSVDVFFIKGIDFLIGLASPLGYTFVEHIKDRSFPIVGKAILNILSKLKSRDFDVKFVSADGEKAIGKMKTDLHTMGIEVDLVAAAGHVPDVERMIQTVKGRVRCHDTTLPYVMTRLMMVMCVLFCVRMINFQPNALSTDRVSPYEQFTGRYIDMKRDLRFSFGDYVQATVPITDNTMTSRTTGCIAVLSSGNLTGSVVMINLTTHSLITRDQFSIIPTPIEVINLINNVHYLMV